MSTPDKPEDTTPYTAFVIGSGCSAGLGVPVMARFLDKVIDELSRGHGYPKAQDDLGAIRAFITRVKGASAYVKADMLNIEELYGMADMDLDLWLAAGKPPPEKWYGHKNIPKDLKPYRVKMALNRAIYHLAAPAGEEFIKKRAFLRLVWVHVKTRPRL